MEDFSAFLLIIKIILYVKEILRSNTYSCLKEKGKKHYVYKCKVKKIAESGKNSQHNEILAMSSVAFVSYKTLLKLRINSGSWQMCLFRRSSTNKDYTNASIFRWLNIQVNSTLEHDCIFLSEDLLYNIGIGQSADLYCNLFSPDIVHFLKVHKHLLGQPDSFYNLKKYVPQVAHSVHLHPLDDINIEPTLLNKLLCDSTNQLFIVKEKDIFAIDIKPNLDHFSDTSLLLKTKLYFYIDKINPATSDAEFYFILKSTNIYLVSTCDKLPSKKQYSVPDLKVPPCLQNLYNKYVNILNVIIKQTEQRCDISNATNYIRNVNKEPLANLLSIKKARHILQNHEPNYEKKAMQFSNGHNCYILLIGACGTGKTTLVTNLALKLGLNLVQLNAWDLKGDTSGATEGRIKQSFVKINSNNMILLHSIEALSMDRDGNEDPRVAEYLKDFLSKVCTGSKQNFVIATTNSHNEVSGNLWSIFTYHEEMPELNHNLRKETIEWLIKMQPITPPLSCSPKSDTLEAASHSTAGCVLQDLTFLVLKIANLWIINSDTVNEEESNSIDDIIHRALDEFNDMRNENFQLARIPKVSWEEIGGLEEAKKEILATFQLPLLHPNLISINIRRSGILLYGPPGTGKTLLAKAVASLCKLNFVSVKGPELLDMYVGQSEHNVRQVFSKAKSAAPCVVFFDEMDALAPNRGQTGDSGGVMDRIVSALLTELDGISDSSDVFVLAATNRPDLVDPALIRPGRFDKQVYVGVCEDKQSQMKLLRAVIAKIPLHPDVSLSLVSSLLPSNTTGADLVAIVTEAFYLATQRVVLMLEEGVLLEEDAKIEVCTSDFETAIDGFVPSVSEQQLQEYKALQQNWRK